MVAAFFRFLWLPWQLRGFSVFRFDYAGVIRSFEVTRGDRFESWARVPRLRSLPLAALAPLAACLV
ncbi:MAG TPA: hypothetical protein PLV77_06380, partial [Solirubrobacterales bacterium]|nr:hypothetical protein [Solirubrobacterales bacterium]